MWSLTANSLLSCADTTQQHHLCMGEDQALYLHTTNLLYWQVFIISPTRHGHTHKHRIVDPGLRQDTHYTGLSQAENPPNLEFVSIV